MGNQASPAYFDALEGSKRIHEGDVFTGKFVRPHAPFIKEIISRLGCKSVLDYGCGKGQQYEWVMPIHGMTLEQYWGVQVTKYDPAWAPFAAEPQGKFDLVICTHVLGAIPKADLGWVVDRLHALAGEAIYIAEKIGKARKQVLADPSLMPAGWSPQQWLDAIHRESPIEVTVSTREKFCPPRGTVTTHWRSMPEGWVKHQWPEGTRPLNKEWA